MGKLARPGLTCPGLTRLLLRVRLGRQLIPTPKPLHPPGGVHKPLLASIERVALGTDVQVDGGNA